MPDDTTTASQQAPPKPPDPIWEATRMDHEPTDTKAWKTIIHVLNEIRRRPELAYEMGVGTESFALLTETLAAINGLPVKHVRQYYAPKSSEARGSADKKRLDWLICRLEEMTFEFPALLGLAGFGSGPRDAIDRAMSKERP